MFNKLKIIKIEKLFFFFFFFFPLGTIFLVYELDWIVFCHQVAKFTKKKLKMNCPYSFLIVESQINK